MMEPNSGTTGPTGFSASSTENLGVEQTTPSLDSRISSTIEEFSEIKMKIPEMERKIGGDKVSLLTIFGIFASIVTFLSVELQILKSICDFNRLVGMSLLVCAVLIGFIIALQYITKTWIENTDQPLNASFGGVIFVFTIFFLGGLWFINQSESSEQTCLNQDYIGLKNELKNKYDAFGSELSGYKERLETLNRKITSLTGYVGTGTVIK